jgi:hypothetical protein
MTTEAAAPAAPAAAPTEAALPDTAATAAPAPEAKPEEKQPPEKTFSQKELDDILEKRLAKERRKREELQRRLAVTEELALRGRPEEPKAPPKPAESNEPKREQFQDYESFLEARAEWRAEKKVDERLDRDRKEREQTRTAEDKQKLEKSFREHAQKVAAEIEDFEDVMSSASDTMITETMADAVMHAGEIGPRLLYHLAKNPAESQRIATLPTARQAAEIGKIEAKLSAAPEPKKPSKAPEPINPIGGKAPATDDEPDSKNTKAWIAWRERQLRAKRKG